jgi:energy-coupling factor transporter ATP-binding protein EcfA2
MMIQRDVLFFHAASLAIGGKGVLIFGPKGAGKTTISLALAGRDHSFLGDEYAAVSASDFELLPFRRTASIREGPRTEQVDEYLAAHDCQVENNLDGTTRRRACVGEIFPGATPRSAFLTHAFFLSGFASRPGLRRFQPGIESLHLLAPLLCTVWGVPASVRALSFLRLLSRARCYQLEAGGHPDETAALVEQTVEESGI